MKYYIGEEVRLLLGEYIDVWEVEEIHQSGKLTIVLLDNDRAKTDQRQVVYPEDLNKLDA